MAVSLRNCHIYQLLLRASNAESDLRDILFAITLYVTKNHLDADEQGLAAKLSERISNLSAMMVDIVAENVLPRQSNDGPKRKPTNLMNEGFAKRRALATESGIHGNAGEGPSTTSEGILSSEIKLEAPINIEDMAQCQDNLDGVEHQRSEASPNQCLLVKYDPLNSQNQANALQILESAIDGSSDGFQGSHFLSQASGSLEDPTDVFGSIKTLNQKLEQMKSDRTLFLNNQLRIQNTLDLALKKINHINSESGAGDMETVDDDNTFPLTNLEELDDLNKRLKTPGTRQMMVKTLSRLGGTGANRCARNLFTYMIRDTLCAQLSWHGTHEKQSFKKYDEIVKLVLAVVLIHFPEYTLSELMKFSQEYLKHTKTRLSRKL